VRLHADERLTPQPAWTHSRARVTEAQDHLAPRPQLRCPTNGRSAKRSCPSFTRAWTARAVRHASGRLQRAHRRSIPRGRQRDRGARV